MKKAFFILFMLAVSRSVFSADFISCHVTEIVLVGDVNAHVRLDCFISNTPTCVTAKKFFTFDKSTEAGKQYLSLVMTAFTANMKVTGFIEKSENSCPAWQNNVALLKQLRVAK